MTRIAMQGVGYAFLVLGVLGLFLPILQGILFIAVGLIILSRYADWARNLLDRFKRQHPKADQIITKAEELAARWGDKVVGLFKGRS